MQCFTHKLSVLPAGNQKEPYNNNNVILNVSYSPLIQAFKSVTLISIVCLFLGQFCLVRVGTFREHRLQSSAGSLQGQQCVLGVALCHCPVDISYCSSHW